MSEATTAAAEHTATGKPHFEILDGLRGAAAVLVVIFHIQGITVAFAQGKLLLPHAYLAVDFFFALSGFVIGYAYDDRWGRMSLLGFFRTRLIRLHPLVVLGVLMGLASYLLDPFDAGQQTASLGLLAMATVLGALLLPTQPLPNRWHDTHTLNGPSWTLLQEYLGNIAYALVLRRLPNGALMVIAAIGALALFVCGAVMGTLDRGYGWDNLWMAPVRLCFPFVAGLLIWRLHDRLPRIRLGFGWLSLALAVVFALPTLPEIAGVRINGLYEAFCVVVVFPLIVIAGAHSASGAGAGRLCRISGHISYPLYITHFPLLFVWMNYLARTPLPGPTAALIATGVFALTLAVAWAALKLWDEPIRRFLRRKTA